MSSSRQSHSIKQAWGALMEQKKQYAAYRRAKAVAPEAMIPEVSRPDYASAINLFLDELTSHEPLKRLEHHIQAWPRLNDKTLRFHNGDTPKKLWDRMLTRRTK